jgi:hypothetical protein
MAEMNIAESAIAGEIGREASIVKAAALRTQD